RVASCSTELAGEAVAAIDGGVSDLQFQVEIVNQRRPCKHPGCIGPGKRHSQRPSSIGKRPANLEGLPALAEDLRLIHQSAFGAVERASKIDQSPPLSLSRKIAGSIGACQI